MTEHGVGRTIDLVVRRWEFLELLVENVLDKRTAEQRLDCHRSTVDRAIGELEDAGLVERTDGGYAATLPGRLAYEAFGQFRDEAATVARMGDLLARLPADADLPTALLEGAEVHRPERPTPYRPREHLESLATSADRIRGLAKSVFRPAVLRRLRAAMERDDLVYECVHERSALEYARADQYEYRRGMVATGNYHPYVLDRIPFALFVFDRPAGRRAALVVYNETNDVVGVIDNERSAAVESARRVFGQYRERAADARDRFRGDDV